MRSPRLLLPLVVSCVLGSACSPASTGEPQGLDVAPDVASDPEAQGLDSLPDGADSQAEAEPGVDWTGGGPLGHVFLASPAVDDGRTTTVALRHLDPPARELSGAAVQVYNCLRDDGAPFNQLSGMKVCTPTRTALAGADGSWLHILPPEDAAAIDDAFSEVQMYFHVTRVHDYFRLGHGVAGPGAAVPAIVNFGIDGGGGFEAYDNAAFMPDATVGIYGLPLDTSGGAIVFGQGEAIDYAWDASVIYHEYTHLLTGEGRLFGYTADEQGFNAEPFSMNEAFADYFAATILDDPVLGRYALVSPERDASRDLSELRTCPEHIVGEVHYDGRVWASALWDLRQRVGAAVADPVALATLLACGGQTTFSEASELLLASARVVSPEVGDAALAALDSRGVRACRRVKPWRDVLEVGEHEFFGLPGRLSSGHPALNQLTTMAYQYVVDVPSGVTVARLDLTAEAGFGWQGPLDLALAVRHGQQVLYEYPGGKLSPVADAVLSFSPPSADGQPWTAELAGPWLVGGPLHLHLLNRMIVDVEIRSLKLVFGD